MPPEYCFWCNPGSRPIAPNEGPHATWCPHFRESQLCGEPSLLQEIVANSTERWLERNAAPLAQAIDEALRRAKKEGQNA